MYNFKMPSNLVQRGQPLPEMPEGVGMPMPEMPSMQPDQAQVTLRRFRQERLVQQGLRFDRPRDQMIGKAVGDLYDAQEAEFIAAMDREALSSFEAVLTRAIGARGSTIRDYVGGSGLRGRFQNEFAVYGRTGEACPACGAAVAVARYAGRASHYCPLCQSASRKVAKPRASRPTA